MKTLQVNLGTRSYPIHVGPGLLERTDLFEPYIRGARAVVITNETIAPLFAKNTLASVSRLAQVHLYILPDGEIHKNLDTISGIFDELLSIPCDRNTTVIALGGGVVGDISGFAAACYQRGVPYIHLPTSLLAQVDSSIGGKTGVNHPLGKNMIGAIYQPQCVISDTSTLDTLPDRELRAGLAEVIKYGLIRDYDFFEWLESNIEAILKRDPQSLAYAIAQSCRNKAEVVEEDERETGVRALLNFGHTFGHAIENWLNYKDWLHGEAVAAGMALAADFSYRMNLMSSDDRDRVKRILLASDLPVAPPDNMDADDFMAAMALDKKVDAGTIRIIALRGIGNAIIQSEYPAEVLEQTLRNATRRV